MEENNPPMTVSEQNPAPSPVAPEPSADHRKICAALCYLLIGLIWYAADEKFKKDAFVKFHFKQGILTLIASLAIQVAGWMVPIIGWFLIIPLGNLFILILVIIGIINATTDTTKELPLIGQFAKKLNF